MGYATLDQLRNAPPGTVFKERRHGGTITLADSPGNNREFRTAGHATRHAPKPATTVEGGSGS